MRAEVVRVGYTTTITDAAQTPFSNAVDVISNGITVPKNWAISHYGAFGSASGKTVPTTTPATTAPATTATTRPTTNVATTTPTTVPTTVGHHAGRTTPVVVAGHREDAGVAVHRRADHGMAEPAGLLLLIGGGLVLLGRRRAAASTKADP